MVVRHFALLSLLIAFVFSGCGPILAQDATEAQSVLFDVPALLEAKRLQRLDQFEQPGTRLIAITIPVTSEIRSKYQGNITAFRFDAFWNRNPFPVSDYAPRTQTYSDIAGTIAVDKFDESTSGLDVRINGSYPKVGAGSVQANGTRHKTLKTSYEEIPQHEILVASGTIRRGTGAFFRFHPSRAETLEGGRELLLVCRVPFSWRGGVMQVECTAIGSRKFLGFSDPIEEQRVFIVPIFLEGDEDAERSAIEFVHKEQDLRSLWNDYLDQKNANINKFAFSKPLNIPDPLNLKQSLALKPKQTIPDDWVHALIQLNDQPLTRFRSQLPTEIEIAADRFVQTRSNHLKLGN